MTKVEASVIEDKQLDITYNPATIDARFDDFEAQVEEYLSVYKDAEWNIENHEDYSFTKRSRAYLNSKKNEIESRRKAVKREYMKPYEEFEGKIKSISSKIDDVTSKQKEAIDKYDELCKDRRKDVLMQAYEEYAGLLVPLVPIDTLLDGEKWLNRSFPEMKAIEGLKDKIDKIDSDWEMLKNLSIPNYDDAESEFFRTLDVSIAIRKAKELEEDRQKRNALKQEIAKNTNGTEEPAINVIVDKMECIPDIEENTQDIPVAPVIPQQTKEEPLESWNIYIPSARRSDMVALASILKQFDISGTIRKVR